MLGLSAHKIDSSKFSFATRKLVFETILALLFAKTLVSLIFCGQIRGKLKFIGGKQAVIKLEFSGADEHFWDKCTGGRRRGNEGDQKMKMKVVSF